MSWSLSTSGHTASEADEASLVDDLRTVLTSEYAGTSTAVMYTSHHGTVNLLEQPSTDSQTIPYESGGGDESGGDEGGGEG